MVAYIFSSNTQGAEAEELPRAQGQPRLVFQTSLQYKGLHRENKNKNRVYAYIFDVTKPSKPILVAYISAFIFCEYTTASRYINTWFIRILIDIYFTGINYNKYSGEKYWLQTPVVKYLHVWEK